MPDSHASRILERFVHLIQARTRCLAFHPSAERRVILASPTVFSVLRRSRRGEVVAALTNVTAVVQELPLALDRLGETHIVWRDRLKDRSIRAEHGVLRVPLDASDVIWLEPIRV